MQPFQQAKEQLQLQAVAERYTGQTLQRGKLCCPFHPDKHPSMQLKNERYHCFVCEAHGDAIDFTARYFHESQAQALTRLQADFALHLPEWNTPPAEQTPAQRAQAAQQAAERQQMQALTTAFLQWENATYTTIAALHRTAWRWQQDWAPTAPYVRPHPRYLLAIRTVGWLRYLLDAMLEREENRIYLYKNTQIRKEIYELTKQFEHLAYPSRTSPVVAATCDAL